ncbi:hypothetical protein MFRU_012g01100 [Monilinia fructicola]|uniref:Ribosome biogenesis protein ALB1 n=1 Tax=Monilinia fructicola TaxID=38448 RepID=A0A5M9JIK3_MONFR|nr:hypothetical protein EYC84_007576 [Monilinia fructicola]KAG4030371.1 hypothetical protein MFRU_012g01100 [Monilinia fructicola]
MASKSNPNVPQKKRKVANRAKTQRKNAINKITKNPRGTRASTVLFPTSGPLAPVSGKKARKLQKAQNCARQRALEKAMKEGEVNMTDAPEGSEETAANGENQGMEVDNIA